MGWIWPGLPPSSAPVKLFHADPGVIELGHSTWALPGTCEPGTCLTPKRGYMRRLPSSGGALELP